MGDKSYDVEEFLNRFEDGSDLYNGPCPIDTIIPGDFDGDILEDNEIRRLRMNIAISDCHDLDSEVVEMVRFFNENGLVTRMSCQGHNETNMSMFWIEFDPVITLEDIVKFQKGFLNWQGNFCSNGSFGEIVYLAGGEVDKHWRYMAASITAANDDLNEWKQHQDELNKLHPIKNFIELNYDNIVLDVTNVNHDLLLQKLKEDYINHLYELDGAHFVAIWNCDLQGFEDDCDIYLDTSSKTYRMAELVYQDNSWYYRFTSTDEFLNE